MRALFFLLPAVVMGTVGCGNHDGESVALADNAIVGGNLEPDRYPAAGYLVFRLNSGPHAGEIFRPDCGAALIAPNAVVTAAHCVEEHFGSPATTIAVGFGDGLTGTTYPVIGTWRDWIHPRFIVSGRMDTRHDVAVIVLAQDVPAITPMPLANRAMAAGTSALVIGYGRVVEGRREEELDDLLIRPEHRDRYPGTRKSSDLTIAVARDVIDAYPKPDTEERKSGGICFADSGSALILDDGSVAGVLAAWTDKDNALEAQQGVPRCRKDNGGRWANLQHAANASFVATRLAAAAEAHAPSTPAN